MHKERCCQCKRVERSNNVKNRMRKCVAIGTYLISSVWRSNVAACTPERMTLRRIIVDQRTHVFGVSLPHFQRHASRSSGRGPFSARPEGRVTAPLYAVARPHLSTLLHLVEEEGLGYQLVCGVRREHPCPACCCARLRWYCSKSTVGGDDMKHPAHSPPASASPPHRPIVQGL